MATRFFDNSTIVNNTAATGQGGAIVNADNLGGGTITLDSTVLAGNTASGAVSELIAPTVVATYSRLGFERWLHPSGRERPQPRRSIVRQYGGSRPISSRGEQLRAGRERCRAAFGATDAEDRANQQPGERGESESDSTDGRTRSRLPACGWPFSRYWRL